MRVTRKHIESTRYRILQLNESISDPASLRAARRKLSAELEEQGQKELADLLMTYFAVFGERSRMSDEKHITTNIYGGNFANVNFGNQLGEINASIQTLSNGGGAQSTLSQALRALTDGVEKSDLDNNQKKKLFDALALVSGEAAKPAPERQDGIVQIVLESMPKMLSAASSLTSLWNTFGKTVTDYFYT